MMMRGQEKNMIQKEKRTVPQLISEPKDPCVSISEATEQIDIAIGHHLSFALRFHR